MSLALLTEGIREPTQYARVVVLYGLVDIYPPFRMSSELTDLSHGEIMWGGVFTGYECLEDFCEDSPSPLSWTIIGHSPGRSCGFTLTVRLSFLVAASTRGIAGMVLPCRSHRFSRWPLR